MYSPTDLEFVPATNVIESQAPEGGESTAAVFMFADLAGEMLATVLGVWIFSHCRVARS